MRKEIVVFAGPNASGKSTIAAKMLKSQGMPDIYLSVNEMVKDKNFSAIYDERTKYISALNYFSFLTEMLIESEDSFAFETVLSSHHKIDLIKKAKAKGYKIRVVYVTTSSPHINLKRVERRLYEGGPEVPWDKVISRYEKCMNNLADIWNLVDVMDIYDTSEDEPLLVALKYEKGCFLFNREIRPDWIYDSLVNSLKINDSFKDFDISESKNFVFLGNASRLNNSSAF